MRPGDDGESRDQRLGSDDRVLSHELRDAGAEASGRYLRNPGPHASAADDDVEHRDGMRLAEVTTLRLGGPCADVVVADTEEVLAAETLRAEAQGVPLLLVAGGSNLVIGDAGWPGRTILVRTRGIDIDGDIVTAAAGEPWDGFVEHMVSLGRSGVEALSGIPGSVGATPVQNVGAYGQEVADTIDEVLVLDRATGEQRWWSAEECRFGYRDSKFKRDPGSSVVLAVRFRLPVSPDSAPVRYAELARDLEVTAGETTSLRRVREAVLRLRASKGMVLDAADHDTWSVGSFFTNPVLSPAEAQGLPTEAPRYGTSGDRIKTSAAWLIEQSGFARGWQPAAGARVGLSTKHTLALTNRGGASTEELLHAARVIRDSVAQRFGIRLVPEPVLVDCQL